MQSAFSNQKTQDHRRIAIQFFELISQQKFKEGLKFFAPNCKTHNPYIAGNMDTLTDAMITANRQISADAPNAEFRVRHILADGEIVAVHTELLNSKANPRQGGLRQVHLLRFDGDKIVEYWDITQQVMADLPNTAGAF